MRKLITEGYAVWSEHLDLLGGEDIIKDIDEIIKNQACAFIAIYSSASLRNSDIVRQRIIAVDIGEARRVAFVIPIKVGGFGDLQLDNATGKLKFISFESNWAEGLKKLLLKLDSLDCPKPHPNGRQLAANSFFEKEVLHETSEQLFSNCLVVESIPELVYQFESQEEVSEDRLKKLALEWAYRKENNKTFLSFYYPPDDILNELCLRSVGDASWLNMQDVYDVSSRNLIVELLRKGIIVYCCQKGMEYCEKSKMLFFPENLAANERLNYIKSDGSKSHIHTCGLRTFGKKEKGKKYRYYLSPDFSASWNLFSGLTVILRVRVRLTDEKREILTRRQIVSRRKHLCKNWWNDDFLNRTLAICQFLSSEEGKINIGNCEGEKFVISGIPFLSNSPLAINEATLSNLKKTRDEFMELFTDDSDNG
jgi:hypothetical protein